MKSLFLCFPSEALTNDQISERFPSVNPDDRVNVDQDGKADDQNNGQDGEGDDQNIVDQDGEGGGWVDVAQDEKGCCTPPLVPPVLGPWGVEVRGGGRN